VFNIYCITNKINGKKYVGLTQKTLEERWNAHVSSTKKKNKYAIHNAMLKYGIENFSIELLERNVEKERETFWIKELNTYKAGTTQTRVSQNQNHQECTKQKHLVERVLLNY